MGLFSLHSEQIYFCLFTLSSYIPYENFKKTYDEIARFSKRDADMYEWITERYEKSWRMAFRKYRYSPPTPWGLPNPLEELFKMGGNARIHILKGELGEKYRYYEYLKKASEMNGIYARMPYDIYLN